MYVIQKKSYLLRVNAHAVALSKHNRVNRKTGNCISQMLFHVSNAARHIHGMSVLTFKVQ